MSRERRRREDAAARTWTGAYRPYDILKEATIALGVVLALTLALTILFSSPDDPPSTIQQWSRTDPVDFITTATTELDGTSATGGYGPPYNHAADGQHIAFVYPAKWLGVSHPINTAQDFVLAPLRSITGQPALQSARLHLRGRAGEAARRGGQARTRRRSANADDQSRRIDHGQTRQLRAAPDDDGLAARASPRAAAWTARC